MSYKLGELLTRHRESNRYSARSLAKVLGVSPTYMKRLETGIDERTGNVVKPSLEVCKKISNVLALPLGEEFTHFLPTLPSFTQNLPSLSKLLVYFEKLIVSFLANEKPRG